MGGKGKKRAWLALVACAALALVVALCGCSSTSGGGEGQTEAAAEGMSVRVKSPEGSVEWGTTLTAVVSGAPEGAELSYDWQLWSTEGEKWLSYGEFYDEGRQASFTTEREWTGLRWRCVVTASGVDGTEFAKAASGAVGPIEAQDAEVKGVVHHPEPMRVGKTLYVELDLPEGAEALVRWMRAPSWDGEYACIDGTEGAEYTLTEADLGCYIACRVDATGVGYVFEGDTEKISMPVLEASGGSGSCAVVYVCDSASESWYHTYDCDELSRLRQLGYSTREVSIDEAKTYCTPCPYCMQ